MPAAKSPLSVDTSIALAHLSYDTLSLSKDLAEISKLAAAATQQIRNPDERDSAMKSIEEKLAEFQSKYKDIREVCIYSLHDDQRSWC